MSDTADEFDLGPIDAVAGDPAASAESSSPRRLEAVSLVSLVNDRFMHQCAVDAARAACSCR